MPTRSWPYVILVSVVAIVILALVLAPFYVTLDRMQTSSVANQTQIDSSNYDTNPEQAVEDSTYSLKEWTGPGIIMAIGMATLIAARQGRG